MSIEEYTDALVEFIRVHEVWAPPIVGALAFAESLAFISLLVPAWSMLIAIGALIGGSGISLWPILVAGAVGAALGDWLSYWVGVKVGPAVAHMWPLSRHPELIPRGERFVKVWGGTRDFRRPLLRAAARLGAAGRRHLRDAVLVVPGRELL